MNEKIEIYSDGFIRGGLELNIKEAEVLSEVVNALSHLGKAMGTHVPQELIAVSRKLEILNGYLQEEQQRQKIFKEAKGKALE